MKLSHIVTLIAGIIVTNAQPAIGYELKGEILYTQVNMYSLKGKKISWVNYSVDTLIPVNTPVIVKSSFGSGAIFVLKDTGQKITLKNKKGKSKLTGKAWVAKHFAKNKVNLEKFTAFERKNIQSGTIQVGMSKEAVIISRGFPPAHVTPSLDSSTWMYWHNRWDKKKITFTDNKVSHILD